MTRPSLKSRFGEQIRAFVGYKPYVELNIMPFMRRKKLC